MSYIYSDIDETGIFDLFEHLAGTDRLLDQIHFIEWSPNLKYQESPMGQIIEKYLPTDFTDGYRIPLLPANFDNKKLSGLPIADFTEYFLDIVKIDIVIPPYPENSSLEERLIHVKHHFESMGVKIVTAVNMGFDSFAGYQYWRNLEQLHQICHQLGANLVIQCHYDQAKSLRLRLDYPHEASPFEGKTLLPVFHRLSDIKENYGEYKRFVLNHLESNYRGVTATPVFLIKLFQYTQGNPDQTLNVLANLRVMASYRLPLGDERFMYDPLDVFDEELIDDYILS